MSCERFHVSDVNPNDQIGGGGCLCSPTKTDCQGPFAVFYGTETDSSVSPHVVISLACARAVVDRCENGEALSTSADVLTLDSTAEEISEPADEDLEAIEAAPENPTASADEFLDLLDGDDIPEL